MSKLNAHHRPDNQLVRSESVVINGTGRGFLGGGAKPFKVGTTLQNFNEL